MNKQNISKFISKYEAIKVEHNKSCKTFISVANEVPVTIFGNGTEICTLMCSPSDLKELTYGFLYNSGIISDLQDIISFNYDKIKHRINFEIKNDINPDCLKKMILNIGGKGIKYTEINKVYSCALLDFDFKIEKEKVTKITEWFQNSSGIYKATGGVHSSSLSVNGEIPEIMYEDVARHNSVDKVIGKALLQKTDFSKCMLLCSCRVSSEILNKAVRCRIPVIISLKSPTHQAILLTKKMKLTLIGLVRESSFIIYTNQERIVL